MKRIFSALHLSRKRALIHGVFALFCSAIFCTVANGQGLGTAQEIGDLSGKTWKSAIDFNETLASERARMDVMLAAPNLQQSDRALFQSYQRLIDYVQADAQAGIPVGDAILKNYEKILAGAPLDQNLKDLPPNSFGPLVSGLVEVLTVAQMPVPNSAN